MDHFATTSFTRQLLLQSSSFQIFVGVLDKSLETNVCKYQVPRDDKIVDHSHGITLNESTAPDTSSSTLTRAFVCSTAFYILIKSLLRLFIFQTVSNTAKFCGKRQFPYCFGWFAQNSTKTMPFRKMSTPGNWWNYGILRSVISSHIFGVRKERERLSVPK